MAASYEIEELSESINPLEIDESQNEDQIEEATEQEMYETTSESFKDIEFEQSSK